MGRRFKGFSQKWLSLQGSSVSFIKAINTLEFLSPLNVPQMWPPRPVCPFLWQHCMDLSRNLMEGWMKGWAKDSGHPLDG